MQPDYVESVFRQRETKREDMSTMLEQTRIDWNIAQGLSTGGQLADKFEGLTYLFVKSFALITAIKRCEE